MSVTTTCRATPPAANGSSSRPRLPAGMAEGRRSPSMALVGLASLVLGALVAAGAYVGLDRRQSVLVVARPVASGQVIAAEDLRVAEVSASPGAATVPSGRRGEVVGKTAAAALVPGAVLAPAHVGTTSSLGRGEAVVGVPLKAGQAPSGLRAGTRVQVVDTGGTASAPLVVASGAVVADLQRSETGSGVTVASLRVPDDDAVDVAAAGAAGRVSLVVLPAS